MVLQLFLLSLGVQQASAAAAASSAWFSTSIKAATSSPGSGGNSICSATKLAIALGRSGLFLRPFHHHLGFPASRSSSSRQLHLQPSGSSSSSSASSSLFSPNEKFAATRRTNARYTTSALRAALKEDTDATAIASAKDSSPLAVIARRPVLALVDTAALLAFAAVGKASHDATGALSLVAVAQTALPFVASWFVTSPLTGVYDENSSGGNLIQDTLIQTAKGWALAIPLGCVLRGVLKGYAPPVPFVIVTMIATLVVLTVARLGYAVLRDFFLELVN